MQAKWIALTAATFMVSPAAAQAQQPYNWSGFYVGLNAGGSWSRSKASTTMPCDLTQSNYFGCGPFLPSPNAAAVTGSGSGTLSDSGVTGGLQAGYNWQANNLVYGVEADFGAFNINAARHVSANYPGASGWVTPANVYNIGSSVDADWLLTARGRIGAAFGRLMVYGTGGLALTHVDTTHTFSDNEVNGPAAGTWKSASTKLGWTIGGGLELAVDARWTVKAEYLYLDFGSVTASGTINNPVVPLGPYAQAMNTSVDLTAQIARVGINYRF